MKVAGFTFALVLAGCYSPAARDCTVSCSAARDCIGGQVCGADHYCAAPSVAGHCNAADASVGGDAPPEHDVKLTIAIMGEGTITVEDITTCDMSMCMVSVPAHVMRTLTANPAKPDKPFQMWMDGCDGTLVTCTINPTDDLRVGAKFE